MLELETAGVPELKLPAWPDFPLLWTRWYSVLYASVSPDMHVHACAARFEDLSISVTLVSSHVDMRASTIYHGWLGTEVVVRLHGCVVR